MGPGPEPRSPITMGTRAALAVVATAGGWILACAGLGMGMTSWRQGWSSAGVLAAVAAGCGISLLLVAATALVRLTRGWGRLVLVPWALLILVPGYSMTLAVAAAFPHVPPAEAEPPAGAERVTMTAADGTRLAGWYVPSRNGAAVIVRHGAVSTSADVIGQAAALADAGYGVLLTDARGHGDSGGRAMDFGWWGEADIAAALDLLAAHDDVEPGRVAVLGLSMGGEEAIGAAAADAGITAVVAEGATWRTAADKEWLDEQYGAAGVVQAAIDAMTYGFADALSEASPPLPLEAAVAASGDAEFLLIAAGDVPDEQIVAERLRAAAPDRVDTWTVPDAAHVGGLGAAPEEWKDRVLGFLDETLGEDARDTVGG